MTMQPKDYILDELPTIHVSFEEYYASLKNEITIHINETHRVETTKELFSSVFALFSLRKKCNYNSVISSSSSKGVNVAVSTNEKNVDEILDKLSSKN